MSARTAIVRLSLAGAVLMLAASVPAVSPHPDAKKKFIEEGVWDQKVANLRAFDSANAERVALYGHKDSDRFRAKMALSPDVVDTVRVCVLLVDFPDFHYNSTIYVTPSGDTLDAGDAVTQQAFDSLLFSVRGQDPISNPTGSMTDFYLENSYGQYFVQGDVHGWFTMPQNYSYYVGNADGMDGGGAQLAIDAVWAADEAGVDFSPYAVDGPIVPGIIVVHAGPGAEQGAYGIWSHRSVAQLPQLDGVYMGDYTLNPEENFFTGDITSIGVFCHEWGHIMGAPDWYDVDYGQVGSDGLGMWSLMAGGSWNDGGRRPAHFDGWTKCGIGFADLIVVTQNLKQAPIPMVEAEPYVYDLRDNPDTLTFGDRWIVENRQRRGFDAALPGSGLIIYHMDSRVMSGNTNPDRYMLAVEEADGHRDLAYTPDNEGDSGDPFPGATNNREFHTYSVPNSLENEGAVTQIGVWEISDSDSIMYADLDITYSRPWVVLAGDSLELVDTGPDGVGDGDGLLEQGETIAVYLTVRNFMKLSFLPTLHVELNNSDLEILHNDASMGTALSPLFNATNREIGLLTIRIPDDFRSSRVTLDFTVTSDSNWSHHDRSYQTAFSFQATFGRPQILLVDDDNNSLAADDKGYRDAFARLGLPYVKWEKYTQGSPSYATLSLYPNVFWMTGQDLPPTYPGGALTAADVQAMKQYLDNGGNLLLASITAADSLRTLDSAFMADYLHAHWTDSVSSRFYRGEPDHAIGGAHRYVIQNGKLWTQVTTTIEPLSGAQPAFIVTNSSNTADYGHCGVTYDGAYRTAFLTIPVEWIDDARTASGYSPKDTLITRVLEFFYRGSATPVEEEEPSMLPDNFTLEQNYPNPFNPGTTIIYSLSAGRTQTNLAIFNVLGQKVVTLVDEVQGPGTYTVTWDGSVTGGGRAASGVYFYRLMRGDAVETKKMVLLK